MNSVFLIGSQNDYYGEGAKIFGSFSIFMHAHAKKRRARAHNIEKGSSLTWLHTTGATHTLVNGALDKPRKEKQITMCSINKNPFEP